MDIYQIIKRPLATEKGSLLKKKKNIYIFAVDIHSNKVEIKNAVEKIFNVQVKSVNTCIMHGKTRKLGRRAGRRIGIKPDWKKAYVVLNKDGKIKELEV
ncbi:MAG: 50S ribosomal protein L23 [Candidatus Firestonebacteria bacterium]